MKTCPTCKKDFEPKRPERTFCGRSCSTKSYAPKPTPIEERFWKHVDRSGACWIWKDAKTNGYGVVSFRGRPRLAHRVAWELVTGKAPPVALSLCHNCPGGDNPACVNPAHLFLGTQKDNMSDAKKKGRLATGERWGPPRPRTSKRKTTTTSDRSEP